MSSKSHLLEFGGKLRSFRTEKHLSLRELARRADMHHPNIAAIEAGRLPVGETTVRRLAHALLLSAEQEERLVSVLGKAKPHKLGGLPSRIGIILGCQLRMAGLEPGNLTEFIRIETPAPFDDCAPFAVWIAVEKGCKLHHDDFSKKVMKLLRQQKHEHLILLVVARKNGTLTVISAENGVS